MDGSAAAPPERRQASIARVRGSAVPLALVGVLAVLTLWNATVHDPITGYDAGDDIAYATQLVTHGSIPHGQGSYYTPPGYFALAGAADWVGARVGMDVPTQAGQYVNALLTIASALLVLLLVRELWPRRTGLHLAAVGFFALVPIVVKTAAMFHPEPLSLFLSTLALLLATRMLRRRDYRLLPAAALGVVLGLAQLARAWSLATVAVVLIGLVVAAVSDRDRRGALSKAIVVVVALAALVPAPWYVNQARLYSNPVFDRPQAAQPLWERRPAAFYLDPALPDVVTHPYSGSFNDRFLPILYSETWGDYFGVWAWGVGFGERSAARAWLTAQSVVGALPSLLAAAGVIALLVLALGRRRTRPELLPVALLPLAAVAAVLYFAVAYPTPDGDTVKSTYALTAAPGFAAAFGLVVDRLSRRRRARVPLMLALAVCALACLRFGIL